MKYFSIFLLTFLVSFCFLVSSESATVTLTQGFGASVKPRGPAPSEYPKDANKQKYNPTTAQEFKFSVVVSVTDASEYSISAELTRSDNKGFAANFGDSKYNDLLFLKSDYDKGKLVWKYGGETSLRYKVDSDMTNPPIPTIIIVRCYDWGASGSVTVTVKKKGDSMPYTATKSIPFDENNNKIADGWETDHNIYVADIAQAQAKASADDETIERIHGKDYDDKWPGDGWTVFDEYRGLFKESTNDAVTRLNPKKKEVMVCPKDTDDPKDMWSYGTGSYAPPEHDLIKIHQDFVKRPFDSGLLTLWFKKDIGWVNFNTPGSIRAYAIRIVKDGKHKDGIGVAGESPTRGPPAPESIVRIFYDGIGEFATTILKIDNVNDSTKWQAAVDVAVSTTISHEIGHNVNCDHCFVLGCVMLESKDPKDYYLWDGQTLTPKRTKFKVHAAQQHIYAVTGAPVVKGDKSYLLVYIVEDSPVGGSTSPTLSPSNDSYTATAGDSHTASFSSSEPYSYLFWYVKSPSESGLGTNVQTDSAGSSSSMTYTFPTGVSGDYVITASGTTSAGGMGFEASYTVSVSTATTTPSAPAAPAPPLSASLSPTNGSYTATAGGTHQASFISNQPYSTVNWYVRAPGDTSEYGEYIDYAYGGGSLTTANFSYTFATDADTGDWEILVLVNSAAGSSYTKSYTVSVQTTSNLYR